MRGSLSTCDTSVLVPALHPLLPGHDECRAHLRRVSALAAHTLLEAYRVLTGARQLPPLPPRVAAAALAGLPMPVLQLAAEEYLPLVQRLASASRGGGAIYDAQIAATAKHHGLTLITRDRRAAPTYELVGADVDFV